MEFIYRARNMEITDALKDYTQKRLGKFERILDIQNVTVVMQNTKDRLRLEVTIPYNGILIRGEEEGYDMFTCIDKVSEKIETQVHKYHDRLIKRGRGSKPAKEAGSEPLAAEPTAPDTLPVRTKTYTTKPMPVEEAIMQMNLLGHSFFAFVDEEHRTCILYRRNDGEYGLLIPEE